MGDAGDSSQKEGAENGSSALTTIINVVVAQLSPSAWLPALFFTISLALLLQFRALKQVNFRRAISTFSADPSPAAVLVPSFLVLTLITQTLTFGAARTLEGLLARTRGN